VWEGVVSSVSAVTCCLSCLQQARVHAGTWMSSGCCRCPCSEVAEEERERERGQVGVGGIMWLLLRYTRQSRAVPQMSPSQARAHLDLSAGCGGGFLGSKPSRLLPEPNQNNHEACCYALTQTLVLILTLIRISRFVICVCIQLVVISKHKQLPHDASLHMTQMVHFLCTSLRTVVSTAASREHELRFTAEKD
jgi:hypothetical protein